MEGEDVQSFVKLVHLPPAEFQKLEEMVRPYLQLQDTNYRLSVSPDERLMITLRFLATGESYRSLAYQFRTGHHHKEYRRHVAHYILS